MMAPAAVSQASNNALCTLQEVRLAGTMVVG